MIIDQHGVWKPVCFDYFDTREIANSSLLYPANGLQTDDSWAKSSLSCPLCPSWIRILELEWSIVIHRFLVKAPIDVLRFIHVAEQAVFQSHMGPILQHVQHACCDLVIGNLYIQSSETDLERSCGGLLQYVYLKKSHATVVRIQWNFSTCSDSSH